MHTLDLSCVPEWKNISNWWCPTSVDTNCPFCTRLVNFPLAQHNHDPNRKTVACTARCPGCAKTVYFWVIDPGPSNDQSQKGCACLGIHPKPHLLRGTMEGWDRLPSKLQKAYREMLDVYNAKVWTATATCCRRTLETMVAHLTNASTERQPLAQKLKSLKEKVNLAEPILILADAIREGGNLGAHFDHDKEPDEKTAEAMVDLIEYFMEYVYVLPAMIDTLKERIDALEESKPSL